MADFDAGSVLGQISAALSKFSESVQVIGTPIEAAGKVVIPAVVARTGFGAGGASGSSEKEGAGGGGGGGGGMMLSPVFLIVDQDGERLLTVPTGCGSLGSVVDSIKSAVEGFKSRHEEEDK
jgi:uncharacterized spore protein YtfJ